MDDGWVRKERKKPFTGMPGTILNIKLDEDSCALLYKTCTVFGQRYVDISKHTYVVLAEHLILKPLSLIASWYSLTVSNSTRCRDMDAGIAPILAQEH